jgi:hypothetical protein
MGALEMRIVPVNGLSISRTRKIDAASETAQTSIATNTVPLRGEKTPKLANSTVSQRTRMIRKGRGTALARCTSSSQRVRATSPLTSSARVRNH